jgi:cytochrome b561
LPTGARYTPVAIGFHWIMFVLVVTVGVLGLLHDNWPRSTQWFWINVHSLLGILLWLTLMGRLLWRMRHAPPALPAGLGALSIRFSSPVHFALYALLFITPILGFITFIYHGRIFNLGLLQVNFGIKKNPAVFHPAEDIHGYLAYALFALAGLHALAALWHRFWLRDGVLARMWPPRPRLVTVQEPRRE